jgi:hypothetical protein
MPAPELMKSQLHVYLAKLRLENQGANHQPSARIEAAPGSDSRVGADKHPPAGHAIPFDAAQ